MAAQGFAMSRYTSKGAANSVAYPISAGSYQIGQVRTAGIVTSGTRADASGNPQFTTAQFNNAFQQTPEITDLRT
jgi:hypothetical protein